MKELLMSPAFIVILDAALKIVAVLAAICFCFALWEAKKKQVEEHQAKREAHGLHDNSSFAEDVIEVCVDERSQILHHLRFAPQCAYADGPPSTYRVQREDGTFDIISREMFTNEARRTDGKAVTCIVD